MALKEKFIHLTTIFEAQTINFQNAGKDSSAPNNYKHKLKIGKLTISTKMISLLLAGSVNVA